MHTQRYTSNSSTKFTLSNVNPLKMFDDASKYPDLMKKFGCISLFDTMVCKVMFTLELVLDWMVK